MAEQVQATIVQIGTKTPLPDSLTISFPTANITIEVVQNSDIAESVITYNGTKYYSSDTAQDLIDAANAGGGGGSSYLSWDAAYQNSAMSSPVGAYLWKDADDNIWKVYEPTRNNTVSRSQYAYADTIDKFPFDNELWFNTNISDFKFVDVEPVASMMQGCTLTKGVLKQLNSLTTKLISGINQGTKTITFNASAGDISGILLDSQFWLYGSNAGIYSPISTNFDGTNTTVIVSEDLPSATVDGGLIIFRLIDHTHNGGYGALSPSDAEIYISGYVVEIKGNFFNGQGNYIDSISNNSSVTFVTALNDANRLNFNDKTRCGISSGIFRQDDSEINYNYNGTFFYDFTIGGACYVHLGQQVASLGKIEMGDFSQLGDETHRYVRGGNIKLGQSAILIPTNDNADELFNIELGMGCEVTTSGDVDGPRFINIAGTTYEMGENTGAMTLTPV